MSNVSWIHFGFKFIVNPDADPIIEYALKPFVGNIWIAQLDRERTELCRLQMFCRRNC